MNVAYAVLIVLAIVYVAIYIWVWKNPEGASRLHLVRYGPTIMIKTTLGMRTMDRLARYTRFWRAFGFVSKLVSALLLFLMLYMLIVSIIALPSKLASPDSIGIEYALAIPGFNPILPLSYGVVALFVAMVVHELGHGIQARANGVDVDSTGLLYAVVPAGAFVEPNDEQMQRKSRRVRMDVFAAGITVNTVVAVLCVLLMVGACGCMTSGHGDDAGVYYVDADSPALEAGIPVSSIITGIGPAGTGEFSEPTVVVDGRSVSIDYDFDPTVTYDIRYEYKGETRVAEGVQMGTFVKSFVSGSPAASAGIPAGVFISSITTSDATADVGNPDRFSEFMDSTYPGQTVIVTTVSKVSDGGVPEINRYEVTLGESGSSGYLGVYVNLGGMTLTTPDIMLEMASNPFYGATTPFSYVTSFLGFLSGPFNGMDPISDEVKWWYDVPLGEVFWMVLSLLYWVFWLNILLGISNALPAYPFDGGFIFAGGVSWLLEKLRIGDDASRQRMTENISNSVSTLVLFMFVLVVLSFLI